MANASVSKQVFWFSIINYLGVIIGILSTLFIYPNDLKFLGLIRTVETYSQIIYPIILIGASQALVHFYPVLDTQNKNRLFWYSLFSVLKNSSLVFLVVMLFFFFNSSEITNYLFYALPIGIAIAFNEVFKRQALNVQKISIPTTFEKILPKLFLPLAFLALSLNIINEKQGIGVFIFSFILMLFLTAIYVFKISGNPFDSSFRSIFCSIPKSDYFKYSLFSFTGSLGSLLAFRIDALMIPEFLGLESQGSYSIGVTLASVLAIPATGLYSIHSPLISESLKSGNLKLLQVKYIEVAKLLLAIGAIAYSCVFIGIEDLFSILPSSDNLKKSIPVILILGLSVLSNMATGFNSEIIMYSKYYRFNIISILLMIIVNVGLNLLFLLYFKLGIEGVAFASLISMVIYNIFKTVFIYRKFQLLPFDKDYFKIFIIVVFVSVINLSIPDFESNFINLIIKIPLQLILIVIILFKSKSIYALNELINKIMVKR